MYVIFKYILYQLALQFATHLFVFVCFCVQVPQPDINTRNTCCCNIAFHMRQAVVSKGEAKCSTLSPLFERNPTVHVHIPGDIAAKYARPTYVGQHIYVSTTQYIHSCTTGIMRFGNRSVVDVRKHNVLQWYQPNVR